MPDVLIKMWIIGYSFRNNPMSTKKVSLNHKRLLCVKIVLSCNNLYHKTRTLYIHFNKWGNKNLLIHCFYPKNLNNILLLIHYLYPKNLNITIFYATSCPCKFPHFWCRDSSKARDYQRSVGQCIRSCRMKGPVH